MRKEEKINRVLDDNKSMDEGTLKTLHNILDRVLVDDPAPEVGSGEWMEERRTESDKVLSVEGTFVTNVDFSREIRTIYNNHAVFNNNATVAGTNMKEFIEFVNRAVPVLDIMVREQKQRLDELEKAFKELAVLTEKFTVLERRIEEMRPPIIMPYPAPVYPSQPTEYPPNPYAPWYDPYRPFITTTGTPIAYPVYFTCDNKPSGQSNAFGAEIYSSKPKAKAEIAKEIQKNGVR